MIWWVDVERYSILLDETDFFSVCYIEDFEKYYTSFMKT